LPTWTSPLVERPSPTRLGGDDACRLAACGGNDEDSEGGGGGGNGAGGGDDEERDEGEGEGSGGDGGGGSSSIPVAAAGDDAVAAALCWSRAENACRPG
jgi:hypothetical protein